MRSPRRSGSALASVGVGRVELLARGRWHPPPPASLATRLIVVGSTGRHVGKTTVAAHLAVAVANLGAHVIAVDMDLRTPALHGILGVERPTLGWQALLAEEIQSLDSSLTSTALRNLHLVAAGTRAGSGGGPGPMAPDGEQRRLLVRQLRALDADVVILDLGAVTHAELADFFSLAESNLLVTSPEPVSLAASLGFLAYVARHAPVALDGAAPSPASPGLMRLVGNQAATAHQIEIFHAFSRLTRAQLGVDLPVIGCVRAQDRLAGGAGARTPLRELGHDRNGRTFLRIAESLLHEEIATTPPAGAAPPAASLDIDRAHTDHAQLGEMLERHRRKHLRHEVDWTATLRIGTRNVAARVVDISLSGAALEIGPNLEIGATATLRFDQLPGQPAVPVVIKSRQVTIRRAGVAFSGAPPEVYRRLVAIAQREHERESENDCEHDRNLAPTPSLGVPVRGPAPVTRDDDDDDTDSSAGAL